ncbi:hypothetical protein DFH09DRAFT_1078319 [Mycena vulgaris]|nr:hypothetical protein DFH09DRAFT_1078319 [Mycena vulgaris]
MPIRCAVPFYGDPGQPDGPVPGQKIYLVSGRNVRCPGAYVSWPSADAQYKSVSNATVKGYRRWAPLEAAWFAACDRGEHDHPGLSDSPHDLALGAITGTLTRRSGTPASPCSSGSIGSPLLSTNTCYRSPPCEPHMLPTSSRGGRVPSSSHLASGDIIPGKMVYAVRHQEQGAVFSEYVGARELYHKLQAAGESAALASTPSLTEGICFVEGFWAAGPSNEAAARRRWIREEHEARVRHVSESWAKAAESWRMNRHGVWTSDSDESSDESSVTVLTAVGSSC